MWFDDAVKQRGNIGVVVFTTMAVENPNEVNYAKIMFTVKFIYSPHVK